MVSKTSSEVNKEFRQDIGGNDYAFSTIGEIRKVNLDSMILDSEVLRNINAALHNDASKRRLVQFVGIGNYNGYFTIICILHRRKVGKLREGKYSAFLYNCDKPELSRYEKIAIKKDWQGNFIWEGN